MFALNAIPSIQENRKWQNAADVLNGSRKSTVSSRKGVSLRGWLFL